jgi:hypothetical protein
MDVAQGPCHSPSMVPEAGHRLTRFDLPPAYAGQSREGYWLAQGAVPINLKDPVEEVRLPQRIHVGNLLSTREENRGCTPREALFVVRVPNSPTRFFLADEPAGLPIRFSLHPGLKPLRIGGKLWTGWIFAHGGRRRPLRRASIRLLIMVTAMFRADLCSPRSIGNTTGCRRPGCATVSGRVWSRILSG